MIVQSQMPYDVFAPRPLPGIQPLGEDPWLIADEAYAGQMLAKAALLRDRVADVIATDAPSPEATEEMLDAVLSHLPQGFERRGRRVLCPDGREVTPHPDRPFHSLGEIVQEDICLLEKRGDQHVLTGAILCFPASWQLSEKIGHPLTRIHDRVTDYTDDIARRVQRLFDGVRPGRALWRFNALWYEDPALFQPRSAASPRPLTEPGQTPFLRSERQVIWRLPKTGAVLFTIHTYLLHQNALKTAS